MSKCAGNHRIVTDEFGQALCSECGWRFDDIELVERIDADTRKIAALQSQVAELESRVPQWVSVEDRLPDADKPDFVLVIERDGYRGIACGDYVAAEPDHYLFWMPYPTPPQEPTND